MTTPAPGTTTSLDQRLLAQAVLDGDPVAALALADLVTEQWNSGERLSLHYLERLEEGVMELFLLVNSAPGHTFADETGYKVIDRPRLARINQIKFNLQQTALSLNRQHLS